MIEYIKFWLAQGLVEIGLGLGLFLGLIGLCFSMEYFFGGRPRAHR